MNIFFYLRENDILKKGSTMKKANDLEISKLKGRRKIWESPNRKWRIIRWPHPFTLCIEKFTKVKKYLSPQWEYCYMDDADVPEYVHKKLYSLISKKRYVYDMFGLGSAT
jgi:hypothetical protein